MKRVVRRERHLVKKEKTKSKEEERLSEIQEEKAELYKKKADLVDYMNDLPEVGRKSQRAYDFMVNNIDKRLLELDSEEKELSFKTHEGEK